MLPLVFPHSLLGLEDLFATSDPGFSFGSFIAVSGHPGAGKSLFCLALIRELMRPSDAAAHFVHISPETTLASLRNRYSSMNWFSNDHATWDRIFHADRCDVVSIDETQLPQPTSGAEDILAQVSSKLRRLSCIRDAEVGRFYVVVDSVTALIKDSRTAGDRRRNIHELKLAISEICKGKLALCFFVVDLLTDNTDRAYYDEDQLADYSIRLQFSDAGHGRRRRILTLLKALDSTPMHLGEHSWLLVQPATASTLFASSELSEYIQRRLQADPPRPRRASLLTTNLQKEVPNRWATIVVVPHPHLPPIGDLQGAGGPKMRTDRRLTTGIPGLDQMLTGDADYWAQPVHRILRQTAPLRGRNRGIIEGSTTLLLGRSGTGKTTSCLQFLLANDDVTRSLYVNFENRPQRVIDCYPGTKQERAKLNRQMPKYYRRRSHLDLNLMIFELRWMAVNRKITRLAIDGLSDLLATLGPREYATFLEDLLVTLRRPEDDRKPLGLVDGNPFVKKSSPDAQGWRPDRNMSLFISLEGEPSPRDRWAESTDSFADNVVVLRNIAVDDVQRTTIEVLKSRHSAPDKQVREIIVLFDAETPLRIVPALDAYRGLKAQRPRPVKIALQIVSENERELALHHRLQQTMSQLFGYKFESLTFSRAELSRIYHDIATGFLRTPYADVKLFSIDEWWIRELRVTARHASAAPFESNPHPLLRLNSLLPTYAPEAAGSGLPSHDVFSSDFWVFEYEKASVPFVETGGEAIDGLGKDLGAGESPAARTRGRALPVPTLRTDIVALPAYMNFGLFCVNRRFWRLVQSTSDDDWGRVLHEVPRAWAVPHDRWFARPDPASRKSLVDCMAAFRDVLPSPEGGAHGFSFDMATPSTVCCMYFELCWAFGATEDFLVRDVAAYRTREPTDRRVFLENHPSVQALTLLMYLVVEGLMPRGATDRAAINSLFTRQWYSTMPGGVPAQAEKRVAAGTSGANDRPAPDSAIAKNDIPRGSEAAGAKETAPLITPLPFFPVGASPSSHKEWRRALLRALLDALVRFERLLNRIRAAVHHRLPLFQTPSDKFDELATWVMDVHDDHTQVVAALESNDADAFPIDDALSRLDRMAAELRRKVSDSPLFPHGKGFGVSAPSPAHSSGGDAGATNAHRGGHFLPAAMFIDVRDVFLLLDWHDLRIAIIRAERRRAPLASLCDGLPNADPPSGDPPSEGRITALTGYCCEGSWLLATDRGTRSPILASNVLNEMTSFHAAVERAKYAAGIPARKDFYEAHGDDSAPNFDPACSWTDALRYTGARARRRERVFCSYIPATAVFETVNSVILKLILRANGERKAYRDEFDAAVARMVGAAVEAAREIFDYVQNHYEQFVISQKGRGAFSPCDGCPSREVCTIAAEGFGAGGAPTPGPPSPESDS